VADEESSVALAAMIAGVQSHAGAYQDWRAAARDRAATFHWDQVLPAACDQLEAWAKGDELDWEDEEEESDIDEVDDE
jgi:hypothetical protein